MLEGLIFYEPSFKAWSMEMGVGKNVICRDPSREVMAEREDPPGCLVAGCQTTLLQHSDVSAAENVSHSWEKLLSTGSTLATLLVAPQALGELPCSVALSAAAVEPHGLIPWWSWAGGSWLHLSA